jgi:hypothetical protein
MKIDHFVKNGLFFVFENALCVFETRKSVVRKEET